MKTFPLALFLAAATAATAFADVPRKQSSTKYARLWSDSPFTSKPPPPPPPEMVNPLDDYVLLGVSPIGKGAYRVTMLNRKNPEERITIEPGDSDYKVIAVNRKAGDPLGTTVRISAGGKEGTISFDETLLTLTPPPAQPQQPTPGQVPGIPGQPQAGQQPQPAGQPGQRQPRQRVVPPPQNPQGQQQRGNNNANTQGRPDRRGRR